MSIVLGLINLTQYLAIAIGLANIGLLLGLIYTYWTSYKQLKSEFTTGLLLFSLMLLIQNILATVILVMLLISGAVASSAEGVKHLLELSAITFIQFIALLILFRITWW